MQIEIAGQTVVYRDVIDLTMKLSGLLDTMKKERRAHDEESERIRKNEKNIQRFLGHPKSNESKSDEALPHE